MKRSMKKKYPHFTQFSCFLSYYDYYLLLVLLRLLWLLLLWVLRRHGMWKITAHPLNEWVVWLHCEVIAIRLCVVNEIYRPNDGCVRIPLHKLVAPRIHFIGGKIKLNWTFGGAETVVSILFSFFAFIFLCLQNLQLHSGPPIMCCVLLFRTHAIFFLFVVCQF